MGDLGFKHDVCEPAQGHGRVVGWAQSDGLVDYARAVAFMEARAAAIADGPARELVWLLEHPPLYTAGTSAQETDLLVPDRFPVHRTGRGGQFTYHGPGQRIAYVMLDVRSRTNGDVRAFVCLLERWLIAALARLGITGETRAGRVGIWVSHGAHEVGPEGPRESKIAAVGLRIRRGVSLHGVSLNIAPDLTHFAGIVPCGIADRGVTSLAELGIVASNWDVDKVLRDTFAELVGLPEDEDDPMARPPATIG